MSSSSEDIVEAAEAQIEAAQSVWGARMAIVAVASALFMQSIDSTALSTALPTLAQAFGTNPIHLKLCLTAYIMALAMFVPASGWAADRFGARRVFMTAMAVFLLGSVLCALSRSLGELVAARVLQGAGGAMMTPVGRIIVVGSHPRERLVQAMMWLTTPAMVGPILGPPLSGFILSVATWPWIFYINVPVGLLGMAAVLRFVPRQRQPHPGRFDGFGFLLAATAICAMMIGAESIGVGLLPLWAQIAAWIVAVASAWAYLRHAKKRERPVLDLKLLRVRTLRVNQTGGSLLRMTLGATPFLLPLLLQAGLGWSPLKAGLVTMSSAAGSLSARFGSQALLHRYGFRTMLIATSLMGGLVIMAPGFFRASTPMAVIVGLLALGGFLRSNHLTSASSLAFADIPNRQVSQASSLTSVVQQMAQAFGITVAGLMLHVSQQVTGPHGVAALSPDNFILPFGVIGLAAMLATLAYLPLPATAGANLHGREGTRGRR
ncbi:MAG: EmrB/QacA family drug resistance transporter [Caulobacteraceae bacterium]|nr:EmrB/QacA family drug resistance transporter [Caulobacteraceae bacterium]